MSDPKNDPNSPFVSPPDKAQCSTRIVADNGHCSLCEGTHYGTGPYTCPYQCDLCRVNTGQCCQEGCPRNARWKEEILAAHRSAKAPSASATKETPGLRSLLEEAYGSVKRDQIAASKEGDDLCVRELENLAAKIEAVLCENPGPSSFAPPTSACSEPVAWLYEEEGLPKPHRAILFERATSGMYHYGTYKETPLYTRSARAMPDFIPVSERLPEAPLGGEVACWVLAEREGGKRVVFMSWYVNRPFKEDASWLLDMEDDSSDGSAMGWHQLGASESYDEFFVPEDHVEQIIAWTLIEKPRPVDMDKANG